MNSTSSLWRPPRGAVIVTAGAGTLALAMALPWISIPGAELQREVMRLRAVPIPATGAAWNSLPLTAALLGVFVAIASLLGLLTVLAQRLRVLISAATFAYGLFLVVVIANKLFVQRVEDEYTGIGVGGYLGLTGVICTLVGALIVLLDARPNRQPVCRRQPHRSLAAPAEPSMAPNADPWRPDPPLAVAGRLRARSALFGAAALLAVYLGTRLSFASELPYFIDEGAYAEYADEASRSSSKLFVSLEIAQGPTLTWFSALWVKLGFGALTAIRLVSVTAGLLTVGVIGLLARALWGAPAGWVAAALSVVLPFFVVHHGIGIYEPLVTLIMAAALVLQIVLARRPNLRIAALLGVVLATGILTKQNTLPALVLMPVSLLCFDWSALGRSQRIRTWLLGLGIVVLMVLAAEAVLRSSSYYPQLERAKNDIVLWPVRPVADVLDDPFGVWAQNWDTYWPALTGYVTLPLILMAMAGALLGFRHRPRVTAVILAWIFVPLLIGMLFQLRPYPRHAMFILPPVIVLCSYAVVQAAQLARRHLAPAAAAAACSVAAVALLAPALILDVRVLAHPATARYPGLDYWQYVAGFPAGGPWPGAADLIRRRATGREVVIVTPGGTYGILRRLLGDEGRYVFTAIDAPLAVRAQFGLADLGFPVDPTKFTAEMAARRFEPIGRFARPKGPCSGPREGQCGGAVIIFERPSREEANLGR